VAIITFILVERAGLSALGLKYFGKFFNFKELSNGFKLLIRKDVKGAALGLFGGSVQLFAGMLELLSEFIRIVSLTFRLFGNMTAGEILLLMIAFLVPMLVPIIFYGLEILIGFIQALIFSGLTLTYLALATSHEAEEH
jgi:F-type H+-transporting ATPase subunit a